MNPQYVPPYGAPPRPSFGGMPPQQHPSQSGPAPGPQSFPGAGPNPGAYAPQAGFPPRPYSGPAGSPMAPRPGTSPALGPYPPPGGANPNMLPPYGGSARPPAPGTPNQLIGPMSGMSLSGPPSASVDFKSPQGLPGQSSPSPSPALGINGTSSPLPPTGPPKAMPMNPRMAPMSQPYQNGQDYAPSPSFPPQQASLTSPVAAGFPPHQAPSTTPVTPSFPQPPQQSQFMPPAGGPSSQIPYGGSMTSRYPPAPGLTPTQPYSPAGMGPMPPMAGGPMPPPSQYASGPGGPVPGQYGAPPTQPGMPPQPYGGQQPMQQPPAARRLDPDQMPSPIQVMEDDRKSRSGNFITNIKGQVPPLVTTDFITQDQGNAGPRFIRSTMYSIPALPDIMKQTAVPFGLVVNPFAPLEAGEFEPPVVEMGPSGPVRCVRCKAYMCPFMQFVDGGRRFQCPFCKATTEVPPEYFQHLDHTGQRLDKYERPELCLGTYEIVATKDYCRNNTFPKPPAYIFVLDVSYNTIKSGLVHLLCQNMKELLKQLPRETGRDATDMKVGFITYGHEVHFYNIKASLAQPQMMVVGDVNDMFMPLLDGFLCDASESEAVIDSLMAQIPAMFAESRETETILGPAIQAGLEALKAAERPGKLLVFHSSLPIAEAPGKLKNRDDRKLLGTEKEKTVLAPQTTFYNQLGQECVGAGVSVDLFVFNNAYIDLATIGQVARLSGGSVYKYTYFQADLDGQRVLEDVKNNLSKCVAFDAIMRIRTSTGVRPVDFYGNFFMSNTTDVELAAMDTDKAVTVEIKHDDKLTDEDGVYIQVAVLFTSVGGQRRLRLLNLSLNTCTQMADLYRNCDLDTVINLLAKQALTKLLDTNPKTVRDTLIQRSAQILACYRKNCASPSSPGQLILPECMKLLPLYTNCLLKSDAVAGGSELATDDRSFHMQIVQTMGVSASISYFYPRLIPLHDLAPGTDEIPTLIRCSGEKLRDDGVYILENGVYLFLWIGLNVNPEWVQQIFGVPSAAQIDIDRTELAQLDNPRSQQLRAILAKIQQRKQRFMRLSLVRQRDKLDLVFRRFLVEDRQSDAALSYVDFLCHLHKEIRNLLN